MYLKFAFEVFKLQLPGRESFNVYGTTYKKKAPSALIYM